MKGVCRARGRLFQARPGAEGRPAELPERSAAKLAHDLAMDLLREALAICAAAGAADREISVLLMPEDDFVSLLFNWREPDTEVERQIAEALLCAARRHPGYQAAFDARSKGAPMIARDATRPEGGHAAMKQLARGRALLDAATKDRQITPSGSRPGPGLRTGLRSGLLAALRVLACRLLPRNMTQRNPSHGPDA